MKISSVLTVCVFGIFAINSHGIIIRHDVAPGEYAVRSSEFPQVFFLEQRGNRKICGATLISAHWALTAAQCVSETLLGSTIEKGEEFQVRNRIAIIGSNPKLVETIPNAKPSKRPMIIFQWRASLLMDVLFSSLSFRRFCSINYHHLIHKCLVH